MVQWNALNGPIGGTVRNVARTSNGMIFTCSEGGIYRTNGLNDQWHRLRTPDVVYNIISMIYVLPGDGLLACTDFQMFRSRDFGETWTVVEDPYQPNRLDLRDIVTDSLGVLFAASYWHGIVRSTDNGDTWEETGAPKKNMLSVCITLSGTILCGSTDGLYRSLDGGSSWDSVSAGGEVCYSIQRSTDGRIYAMGEYNLYRSVNDGFSWTPVSIGNDDFYRLHVRGDATLFAIGLFNGIYRSTDGGDTWSSPVLGDQMSLCMGLFGKDKMLVGDFYGVTATVNNGKSWFRKDSGMSSMTISGLVDNGAGEFLLTAGHQIYGSSDEGATWTSRYRARWWAVILARDAQGSLLASDSGGIIRSVDHGRSWKRLGLDVMPYFVSSIAVKDTGTYFAGTSDARVFRSTDAGRTWVRVLYDQRDWFIDAMIADDSGHIFCGTLGSVFKSTDDGKSWTERNDGTINGSVNTFFIHGGQLYVGTNNGLFRSPDGGRSWRALNSTLNSLNVLNMAMDVNGLMYLCASNGIYRSEDEGETWQWISEGIPFMFYRQVGISSDGYAYMGTQDHGVWRTLFPARPGQTVAYAEFMLHPNYPNPFNARTIITYTVGIESEVEITVYYCLGREVKRLFSGVQTIGDHQVTFDGNGLSSGVYLCLLRAGPNRALRKLVLLR